MNRILLIVLMVVLLGGCGAADQQGPVPTKPSPGPWPASQSSATPEPKVAKRQVDRQPVIPRRLYCCGNLDAPVVKLQLQGDALVPPSDPQVLGWWGAKAGSKHGVTLLVGHTVHTGGGTLDNLEEVALGTDVNVSGVLYTVSSNNVISKAALARRAPHLFSQRGSHRLVVVTCEDYDPATGHYGSNVVMVAKEKEMP